MATPAPQALQRVCPHCATISVTQDRKCPWCRRSFKRAAVLPWVLLIALLQSAITIGAVVYLLTTFGDSLETELDDQVEVVQRDIEKQVDGIDTSIRRKLDRRLPATGATTP